MSIVNMKNASKVLGGLSTLSKSYPPISAAFSLGSIITGIFGGFESSKAAAAAEAATLKYRKEVLSDLTHISNQLSDIESQLGSIGDELKNIYNAIQTSNNIFIDRELAIIDTTWENFAALDPADPNALSSLQTYSQGAYSPSGSVLSAMNTINEMLTSQIFTPDSALEGKISLAGYLYLKSKLLQGLYILGYASFFVGDGRDFGTYFLTWSQNFAEHMKAIIAYGKANPIKADAYTAHFYNYWNSYGGPGQAFLQPFYCTDNLCFSAALTPTMPYQIFMIQLINGDPHIITAGQQYVNRWCNTDPSTIQFSSSIDYGAIPQSQLPLSFGVSDQSGQFQQWVFATNLLTLGSTSTEFDTVYEVYASSDMPDSYYPQLWLAPETHLVTGGTQPNIYMGSVDGILNIIPVNNNDGTGTLRAFLYSGDTKDNLLQVVPGATAVEAVSLASLNTLTNCAVEIKFYGEFNDAAQNSPIVSIRFIAADQYLDLSTDGFILSDAYAVVSVTYQLNAQPIQDPYSMSPVPVMLTTLSGESNSFGAARVVIHQSPFN